MQHPTEEQLILHYYGEAEEAVELEEHLARCGECAARNEGLQRIMAAADTFPIPERGENYGARVWQRLLPQLERRRLFSRSWFPLPRWTSVGAMALLLVVAFLAGRLWHVTVERRGEAVPLEVRDRILMVAVADHLDRLHRVLTELVNTDGNGTIDITNQQQWAHDLLLANRIYRQAAVRDGERAIAGVLDELEPILMEVEHAPSSLPSGELREICRRIDSHDLLFKIWVLSSQARQREKSSAGDRVRRTL
ncbi:MAG TPA: hypothetical protein VGL91_05750 [Acidobacteriota bacterium]